MSLAIVANNILSLLNYLIIEDNLLVKEEKGNILKYKTMFNFSVK
ncbi:MAG TPA: hypothetical protein VF242_08005 [Nitrososphaeraceae archaeon]